MVIVACITCDHSDSNTKGWFNGIVQQFFVISIKSHILDSNGGELTQIRAMMTKMICLSKSQSFNTNTNTKHNNTKLKYFLPPKWLILQSVINLHWATVKRVVAGGIRQMWGDRCDTEHTHCKYNTDTHCKCNTDTQSKYNTDTQCKYYTDTDTQCKHACTANTTHSQCKYNAYSVQIHTCTRLRWFLN